MKGKLIIISAPSGSGKTTIVHRMLKQLGNLEFSVSATSREPRGAEQDGKDYHFLGVEGFKKAITEDRFLEYEEVYPNQFYGTLKSEVERIWAKGNAVIFDIDVVGGLNLKKQFGGDALALFIQPPSMEELERRLRGRQTETEDRIAMRLQKAAEELAVSNQFDTVITNDELEEAVSKTIAAVSGFLNK